MLLTFGNSPKPVILKLVVSTFGKSVPVGAGTTGGSVGADCGTAPILSALGKSCMVLLTFGNSPKPVVLKLVVSTFGKSVPGGAGTTGGSVGADCGTVPKSRALSLSGLTIGTPLLCDLTMFGARVSSCGIPPLEISTYSRLPGSIDGIESPTGSLRS